MPKANLFSAARSRFHLVARVPGAPSSGAWGVVFLATIALGPAFVATGQDYTGPRLISAVASDGGTTNLVTVTFNERVLNAGAAKTGNYSVTQFGTANQVPVLVAAGIGSNVALRLGTNNWYVGGLSNYYLSVSRIQDLASNTIAPDSRIGISWPRHTEILPPDARWHYQAPILEPDILQQPWTSCDYRESPWWVEGSGPFPTGGPAIFRTKFVCPPDIAAEGRLRIDYLVEGAVFYLNGVDVSRVNLCSAPTPLTSGCCVFHLIAPPPLGSQSLTVTNLVAGTNCLAAVVVRGFCLPLLSNPRGEIAFGLRLWGTRLVTGPVPSEEPPLLQITPHHANAVRLSWTGSGFALEKTTHLLSGALVPGADSWMEVSDMSNPYTNSTATHPATFFRLTK